jgi:excinuclease UvrABC helicase subunit UvrB
MRNLENYFNEFFNSFEKSFSDTGMPNLKVYYVYNEDCSPKTNSIEDEINQLEQSLKFETSKENFEKCIEIKNKIDKLKKNKDVYLKNEKEINELTLKMNALVNEQKFEEAINFRNKINKLKENNKII